MFRNGPEGLRGRAGSRPWRPSGHARVAIMLMFNAVATCTSPPSTLVPYIVPDVQSRVYGHPFHALSSLLGVRTSHGSVHLPSGAVANPESPVLGVEPQHRIRKLRAATKSPEQRVDVHAAALSLTPHSEQRVNFSASATNADSLMHASHTVWLPRCRSNSGGFLLLCRHIRGASVPGRCHNRATAAGTLRLPSIRGAARGVSLPHAAIRLKVASKPRDTDGRCHATPFPQCDLYERSTRVGQGPGLSPGSGHEHFLSARERPLPVGGKVFSNAAFPRRSPVALTRATTHLCTTRCTAPRHAPRRLDSSYRVSTLFGSQLPLPLPPSPLLRLPLHHPSRPKGRRPGTFTIDIVSYSAATAITIGQLRASSGGLSCHRSTVISCFSWNDGPTRLLLRLCCTAPALCFLATPKHGSISGSPHCCCSLPHQA